MWPRTLCANSSHALPFKLGIQLSSMQLSMVCCCLRPACQVPGQLAFGSLPRTPDCA